VCHLHRITERDTVTTTLHQRGDVTKLSSMRCTLRSQQINRCHTPSAICCRVRCSSCCLNLFLADPSYSNSKERRSASILKTAQDVPNSFPIELAHVPQQRSVQPYPRLHENVCIPFHGTHHVPCRTSGCVQPREGRKCACEVETKSL